MMADHPPANILDELTQEIKALQGRGQRAYDEMIQALVEIGKRLVQVRELLPHGQWLPWLRDNFRWTDQTARNYMNAAHGVGRRKLEGLAIEPSALYALTAPSADPEALESAIRQARRGAIITYPEARDLVREHRAKSKNFLDLPQEQTTEPASTDDPFEADVWRDPPTQETPPPPPALPDPFGFVPDDDSPSVDELMRQPRATRPPAEATFTVELSESAWWRIYQALQGFLDYEAQAEDPSSPVLPMWESDLWGDLAQDRLALRTALEAQRYPFDDEDPEDADDDAGAASDPL